MANDIIKTADITITEEFFENQPGINSPQLDANVSLRGDVGGSGGHIIQEGTTSFEQRDFLRFDGDAVTVSDVYSGDLGKHVTKVEINHINTNPYGRDNNGYFQLPVGNNMYP